MKKIHKVLVKEFAKCLDEWDKGELFINAMKPPYFGILEKAIKRVEFTPRTVKLT